MKEKYSKIIHKLLSKQIEYKNIKENKNKPFISAFQINKSRINMFNN